MTRETRIGLLVGLLFILAFGLILSELTNPELPAAEQPPAPQEEQSIRVSHIEQRQPERYVVRRDGENWREEVYRPREQETPVVEAQPRLPQHVQDPTRDTLFAVERDTQPVQEPPYEELTLDELSQRFGEQTRQPSAQQTYVVQGGDTLSSIARRMLGDGSRQTVDRLYQANRGWIADPDNIPVGVELVIP
jgi:nucleoid-associated protein YgaU